MGKRLSKYGTNLGALKEKIGTFYFKSKFHCVKAKPKVGVQPGKIFATNSKVKSNFHNDK